jgi:hypothetical protein
MDAPAAMTVAADNGDIVKSGNRSPVFHVVDSKDTLAYLDRHHTGSVDVHDVKVGIHQLHMMKRFTLFLACLGVLLLVANCLVTYLAVSLAKEMHVHNHRVVDTDGHVVTTIDVHDTIHGVKFADSRRLAAFTVTTSNQTSSVVMSSDSFHNTRDEYIAGKTDWVVDMPDGTVRTVHIQGMGVEHAWGLCGACEGSVTWQAFCSWENGTDCMLDWQQSAESTTNSVARRADTFLARAAREPASEHNAENTGLDRALAGKCGI